MQPASPFNQLYLRRTLVLSDYILTKPYFANTICFVAVNFPSTINEYW